MDRRQFLARTGAGAAAAALAGTAAPPTAEAAPAFLDRTDPPSWDEVRDEFELTRDVVYLAHLYLASNPRPVREAITRYRQALDENPLAGQRAHSGRSGQAVRAAARYLRTNDNSSIALTHNTTSGVGLAYMGLALEPDQEVVTTIHDYFATHETLRYVSERTGCDFRTIRLHENSATTSVDEIVGNIVRGIGPKTRVLGLTWVHSSTGLKLPLKEIGEAVAEINSSRDEKDRVLIGVDGVHGFGVENFNIEDFKCDFFAAGTHKWIFGPRGTGILWGSRAAWAVHRPVIMPFHGPAWSAWRSGRELALGQGSGPMATPGGFHPFEHRWALVEAFQFHETVGRERIHSRTHELASRCKEGLAAMEHVTLHTPRSGALSSGLVCFSVRGQSASQTISAVRRRDIIGSTTPYSPSYARFTPAILNTPEDVDAAVRAVGELG